MPELPKPYEIYEWSEGESREFTILKYERGELEIQPRDGRDPKMITVLRLHVPEGEKPEFPHYWDMTSARLTAQLLGMLPPPGGLPLRVSITAIGRAPRTHFSVSRIPERPV